MVSRTKLNYKGSDDEDVETILDNNESNSRNYNVVSHSKSNDEAEENLLSNKSKKKLK